MEEKLADDLIVIGYNQQAYRFIFEALLKELQKKIGSTKAELKKSLDTIDFSSNESEHNNDQKFLDENVESIINDYLTFPETQQQENPLHYLGEDVTEEVASAYLLHRFIGSSVNADRKRNLFKSCFSGNWSLYRKALSNKKLELSEQSEFSHHIGHALCDLDYRKILDESGFESSSKRKTEAALKWLLGRLLVKAKEKNPEVDKSLFNGEPRQLFTIFVRGILDACEFIDKQGGAVKYLKKVDRVVNDVNKKDPDKVKELADEVKSNVKGFGAALSRDFFKDMGYGIFSKPDVHVMDLIRRLNLHLYYEWGNDEEERATYLLSEIAKAVSTPDRQLTANQVDKVFWLLKSGNFHIHQLSKRFLLPDTTSSDICKGILRELKDKGICSSVKAR